MQQRIIALDIGDRRIGIAVSDPLGITAQPLETYTRVGYGPDARYIAQLANQCGTVLVLCGLPRNMDGTQGFQADKVCNFANKLKELGLNVSFFDERLTTVLAERALLEADMTRLRRKQKVDMVSAVMILQSYLDAKISEIVREEQEEMEQEIGELRLEDEKGQTFRYRLVAKVCLDNQNYVILSESDLPDDSQNDESIILRQTKDMQGEICYEPLEDDMLIARVYEAYLSLNARE